MTLVAIVLPPRESYSPEAAGAIGLLVHRQATASSRFEQVVVGRPVAAPFGDAAFQPAHSAPWLGMSYAAGAARVLRRLRPALIEVHNRPEVAVALTGLGAPVTLVLHNDPLEMRASRTPAQRAALVAKLARIVTVSAWLRERMALPGVTVLPNAIDLAALPPMPAERDRTILFAGRMVADKGADAFVTACARALPALSGWRAAMIGADRFGAHSPDTPFLRRLRPHADAAGIALAGWQPHPTVLAAMARAAIVVAPSRWPEPFGMTALEAAACGAAVAYAPRGGLPEVIGEAGVPIDPDDPAGMAAALVALARDPGRRASLAAAGRARAARFDIGRAMTRLDDLRAELLATWPARAPI